MKEPHPTLRTSAVLALLLASLLPATPGELAVTVSRPRIVGDKALVILYLKNNLGQNIEGARAAVFLYDERGKTVEQAARWVIGGSKEKPSLAPGGTNAFTFVLPVDTRRTTNLTVRVRFNRIVLPGGKLADVRRTVSVGTAPD